MLRVWFAILVLLGSSVASVRIGPAAVLQGLVEESRGEWSLSEGDSAEESASQWALLGSRRSVLRSSLLRPRPTRSALGRIVGPVIEAGDVGEVQYRPLPRVLFRRSLPRAEEPPLTNA
jgi:hypothetical protein